MQRLVLDGPNALHWEETVEPTLDGPDQALVRPIAVATCDIDPAIIQGRFPLAGPYPFGHEGVAEVIAVGEHVTTVHPGDKVVVPFQISCGACESCRRGRTGNCTAHPFMSSYGLGPMGGLSWGGFWSDLVCVPHADAMLVPLPTGVDPAAVASASDNIADAYRTVAPHLTADPGAEVLVLGGPAAASIGLYAAGLAVALGSARAVYLDTDPERLALAAQLGAEPVEGKPTERVGRFPITVEATGGSKALVAAIRATAADGVCTSVSVQTQDVALPMLEMYSRCCTFHTGRAHARPTIPHVLDLVATGRFDPSIVTTRTVAWNDSLDALLEGPLKLVATR